LEHDDGYKSYRERQAAISRARSASGREIGPLPKVANSSRKSRCKKSLKVYCETYFPRRFRLAWSTAHLAALDRLERCIRRGGLYALAMPRGSGKTTLAECAALWGVSYGFRRFVVLIGATETHAEQLLDSIKAEVESNDLLAADFPEICHPVRRLEGIVNRAAGQTLGGEPTNIEWTGGQIVLPTVPRAAASGSLPCPRSSSWA
jgi:hypothetical protein